MVATNEVPADLLISNLKDKLKQNEKIKQPDWASFVKTGPHAERKPVEEDWWYTRCASILRRASIRGKIGVGKLKTWYGGRKNRGTKPEHHVDAGGSVIRKAIQQLEAAGYLKKEKAGRVLSPTGQSLIHKAVLEVKGGIKSGSGGDKKTATSGKAKPVRTKAPGRGAEKAAGTPDEAAGAEPAGAPSKGETGKPEVSESKSG